MALAALIYIQNQRLTRVRSVVIIGLLLAIAISFRRHFGYDAIAFLGAIVVQRIALLIASFRSSRSSHPLRDVVFQSVYFGIRIGLLVSTIFVVLLVLSADWVRAALTNDYKALYAGYAQTVDIVAAYYSGFYGWITLTGAVVGLLVGVLSKFSDRSAIFFHCSIGQLLCFRVAVFSTLFGRSVHT